MRVVLKRYRLRPLARPAYVFGNRVAGSRLDRVYQGKREQDHKTSEVLPPGQLAKAIHALQSREAKQDEKARCEVASRVRQSPAGLRRSVAFAANSET
jgi:hypothetical protein